MEKEYQVKTIHSLQRYKATGKGMAKPEFKIVPDMRVVTTTLSVDSADEAIEEHFRVSLFLDSTDLEFKTSKGRTTVAIDANKDGEHIDFGIERFTEWVKNKSYRYVDVICVEVFETVRNRIDIV